MCTPGLSRLCPILTSSSVALCSAEDISQTTTEVSDTSSFLEGDSADSNSWCDSTCLTELEQLSHELANKGPQQAEVELRSVYRGHKGAAAGQIRA